MQETVFCDTCKNVLEIGELKEPQIVTTTVACPQGSHPKDFRYAVFKCPKCSSKSASSIRAAS